MTQNKAWFSDRVRENETGMYALAMSYMKQEADALDCMQQSILKAYEHLDSLRDPERFRSWMFGILINCCKDELRRRGRTLPTDDRMEEEPEPPAAVSFETRAVLWNAVQRLSEPSRTLLLLFYYEDLPTGEIAEAMDVKPATVRKQLERARSALKAELEKEGFSYDG
ncbi:MAG: sigma-70 family RNA polymerase sigma factor [Clostridia bacterium]|nr:sigma-70 family RNA polymerase sigma factor [Clostridia bacterium]